MDQLDPSWTAPRDGQDWRDDELMLAVAWLKSLVPRRDMERRLDAAKEYLVAARKRQRDGEPASLFEEHDTVAWFILQAETFATDRMFWAPEGVMRSVPYLTRIGKELPLLLSVDGAVARAERMMTAEKRQPEGPLFELLVGLAYKRNGWAKVQFVPEMKGLGRTPDIIVSKPRSSWAIECKRLVPSTYAARERVIGAGLAEPVHRLCLERSVSVVVQVAYKAELQHVPTDYLLERVSEALDGGPSNYWDDDVAKGFIRPVNWQLARGVLEKDFVYFGSSRMIELLSGSYEHDADHSIAAKWRPHPNRPEYADAVYQASVVSWYNQAAESTIRKARHFKSTLANAEGQLPADTPGAVHIGIESYSGSFVDFMRHMQNRSEARLFQLRNSRLRWVFANHFVPEATTRRDESWAITETMVPYRVGRHGTKSPLPGHMLVSPESETVPGSHWSRNL